MLKNLKVEDFKLSQREYYLRNPSIKGAYVHHEYSPEQIKEYIKCKRDIIYFAENYCHIITLDEGKKLIELRDYQKKLLRKFQDNRFNLVLQARQSGKSVVVSIFILWYITFHKDKRVLVLANKQKQAKDIVAKIRLAIENIPFFLQAGAKTYNKLTLEFDNGSSVICAATSSDAARGETANLVYIDEAAFIANDMEFYESTYPVISSGKTSQVIMTTTPKGSRGMFYKLWRDSENDANSYVRSSVYWNEVPGRDDAWREETISNTSLSQFRQEHGIEFMGSANTLIESAYIAQMTFDNPIWEDKNSYMKIYEKPKPDNLYVCIVDPAEGVGQDYSVVSVFDVSDNQYKVVAKYRNKFISPLILPSVISKMCIEYNECPVLIELKEVGYQVATILYHDLEYENMLLVNNKSGQQRIGGGFGSNVRLGIKTSKQTKMIGCSNLKTLVETDKLSIKDIDMINELGTFVSVNNSYEADEDCNDDTVATLFIFAWLTTQQYFLDLTERNIRQEIHDENDFEDMLVPVGVFDDNGDSVYIDDDGTRWVQTA